MIVTALALQTNLNPDFLLALSAAVLVLVLERTVMNEPIFDHEKFDVFYLSIDYVSYSHTIATLASSGCVQHNRLR